MILCGGHRGAGDCSVMMGINIPKKDEKETEKVSKDQDRIVEENVDVEKEVKVEEDETEPKDGKVGGKEEPSEKEGKEVWEFSGEEEMETKNEEERKDEDKDEEEEGEDWRKLVILLGENELNSFTSCSVASSGTLITVSAEDGGGAAGEDGVESKGEFEEECGRQLLAGKGTNPSI